MSSTQYLQLAALFLGFTLLEFLLGRAKGFKASAADNVLDLVGFGLLAAVSQPLVFWMVAKLGLALAPGYQNALHELPWAAGFALFLVGDDMLQYWWHRWSHKPLLWPLHRAHHSAQYMSARIIYRNNFFYYIGMPAIWVSGLLVYLGLGHVYMVYIVLKLAVITGAHSAVRWDEPLYRIKALRPLMWLVQRTISTPATHFAHHAMSNADGIGHYTGNYGNLLFFWDILFGSAHITQQYPREIGLRDDQLFGKEKWWIELFYPIFRSQRQHTALTPGGKPYDHPGDLLPAKTASGQPARHQETSA
ncbi:fatty acid hydroxylase [Paucibacter sp. KBW04]|uniref:sterol desaturase family protein n=1 Tax=Paucibacter sp. KBW04 TaxID=2153361 RepID=UPI000F55A316|nr:sterol desaturase family protein [Paucibacter sp. KBW04]RQO60484.1 fatty acid hydroxylase [Paucibacter sp. KBW04]